MNSLGLNTVRDAADNQMIELLPLAVPAEAYDMNSTGILNMSFIDMVGQPKLNAWSFRELAPGELSRMRW